MAKKVYVVCGLGCNNEKEYTNSFLKAFKSEKKADKYYDKMYVKLLEAYSTGTINYYNIDWQEVKIK